MTSQNDAGLVAEQKAKDLIRKSAAGNRETYELTKESFEALLRVAISQQSELSTLKAEMEKKDEALEAARLFIQDQYRDDRCRIHGEWLAPEARPVFNKICAALGESR